jgi:hypothetical protein
VNITCPHCHTTSPLEVTTEDRSARALFGLLAELGPASAPLVAYLGLFRPRVQALRWSRALALAESVLELAPDVGQATLATALVETVESLREKRQAPAWRPLTGHGYLRRVLESTAARGAVNSPLTGLQTAGKPTSKTGQAMVALREADA